MKILQVKRGYWTPHDRINLDACKFDFAVPISFEEFDEKFNLGDCDYDIEHKESIPFAKSNSMQYWLESKKCFVEIRIDENEITVRKVLTNKYDTFKELNRDLSGLNDLCYDIICTIGDQFNL